MTGLVESKIPHDVYGNTEIRNNTKYDVHVV